MKSAMAMPGVKVDRVGFLTSEFCRYGNVDLLKDKRPSELYSEKTLERVASGVVKNHLIKVTAISAAAGIPGGIAVLGTIPADIIQYFWHFLVMAQKLAYVYGWPDLKDENNNLGEEAQAILTIFIGVGFGADGAAAAINQIAKSAAEHYAKRLPRMALMKTSWYPIIKKIGAYLGIKITKDNVGKQVGKMIPILGGIISGSITYATFKPMAKKIKKVIVRYSFNS